MNSGIEALESAYKIALPLVILVLCLMLMVCLIRAIIGPRVADRIVAVNMMGTMVMVIIAILTVLLKEGYLADICLIYAMISFLAVVVLTRVYMGVWLAKKKASEEEKKEADKNV